LPVTERASDGSLAIPMFATMTDDQVDRVSQALVACVGRAAPLPR
jgi:dTDP-4-amino-4,6-dideoxygalactose transaminase